MTKTHAFTVTAHYSRAVEQAAQRAGVTMANIPAGSLAPGNRVSLARQDQLWAQFCAADGDPLVGVELGARLEVGHLGVTGMVLMSCNTMGDLLEALLKYQPIIGEGSHFRLDDNGSSRRLSYDPAYRVCREQRVEATMVGLCHLIAWGTDRRFHIQCMSFRHEPRDAVERYRARIGVPLEFHAADNAITFDDSQRHVPLVHADPGLCASLRVVADQILEQLGSGPVSARVAALVGEHPRWGKERAADDLGVSGRQLSRQLADEGTGFKELRAMLLRQRAEQALDRGLSATRIAAELGFTDGSAFAKAFRRWTGRTPTQYRRQSAMPPTHL